MELAKALVAKATPTFAEVISKLEKRSDLNPARQRDMISGLRRAADAICWEPVDCPADPVWLRPRIAKVKPAAINVSKKTWRNIVSNVKPGLAEAGIIERDRGSPLPLSPAWEKLWKSALATGKRNIRVPVSRFVRFCSNMGIDPSNVSDAIIVDFQNALELAEIRKNPASATWQAIHACNKAVDIVPSWAQIELTKPIRHNHYAMLLEAFPRSFGAELEAMLVAFAKPVLKLGAKHKTPRSPETIEYRKRQWL